jgi:ribosomal protein S18 acetylase RimI-like enzyme
VTKLEPNELDGLVIRSLEEGFKFVQRLRDEYQSGVNRFDQPAEGQPGVLRLRRFYVLPKYRRHGLGQKMLLEVIELARAAPAKILELHTDNPHAARFYERHGFQALTSNNPSHRLEL